MKSILLHVYDDAGFESRLQAAFDLARAFEGHITCLHATPYPDYFAADPSMASALPVELSRQMEERRLAMQKKIEERLRLEMIPWTWVHVDQVPADSLIGFSPLSDVIVLSLDDRSTEYGKSQALAATVATGALPPVLAMPASVHSLDTNAPVIVAWNGSAEASTALRAAVPLLRLAASVHLVEIAEPTASLPADAGARYLSLHGIEAEILQRQPIDGSVGKAILRAALEKGAGLIVSGAYGHSRLREFLLGGVTRFLLTNSKVPLLFAH
ncbi:universal stress protein [Sphingomonas montana]|uniref:universal stress protein n=1 Tax=Sphingomonas montana TaxID=1843236 RepID=UPI00096DCF1B|nr:universal stress protein [Sphingomonas montana]